MIAIIKPFGPHEIVEWPQFLVHSAHSLWVTAIRRSLTDEPHWVYQTLVAVSEAPFLSDIAGHSNILTKNSTECPTETASLNVLTETASLNVLTETAWNGQT